MAVNLDSEVSRLIKLVNKRAYKYLVFDLDETLTQLQMPWGEFIEILIARAPEEISKNLASRENMGDIPWGAVINEQIALDPKFVDIYVEVSHEFETKYFGHLPNQSLVDSLEGFYGSGLKLILWTSNVRPTVEKALLELGVAHLFTKIIARDDVAYGKPHHEGWSLIMETGHNPSEYLFVGDSDNDRLAAESVNVDYFQIDHFK